MAVKHIREGEHHNENQIDKRKRRITKRKNLNKKNQNRNIIKRKMFGQIQKCILITIWLFFAIIGIREIAHKAITCIMTNGAKHYESAVSKERIEMEFRNSNGDKKEGITKEEKNIKTQEDIQTECEKIYNENSHLLILVNKDKILEDGYHADLINICNGRLLASEQLHQDLVQMLSDAGEAGYHYWIASAYRSRSKQQQLVDEDVNVLLQKGMTYEQALQKTYEETMPAGYSEHETGLALDILCENNTKMDISQEKEDANIWLQEHCYQYGFILRYPKNKAVITKINYEPWHFRYVGKEAAKFMKEHDMVLEEFYAVLEGIS